MKDGGWEINPELSYPVFQGPNYWQLFADNYTGVVGDTQSFYKNVNENKKYNTIRPGCKYDVDSIQFFDFKNNTTPETMFVKEEILYDHNIDFKKWKHVEKYDVLTGAEADDTLCPDGITDLPWIGAYGFKAQEDPISGSTFPNPLLKQFNGYGFNYANRFGIGSPSHVWYSHTDLSLDTMIQIKEKIREPIIRRVKEAKAYEEIYNMCQLVEEYEKIRNAVVNKETSPLLNNDNTSGEDLATDHPGIQGDTIAGDYSSGTSDLWPRGQGIPFLDGSDWDPSLPKDARLDESGQPIDPFWRGPSRSFGEEWSYWGRGNQDPGVPGLSGGYGYFEKCKELCENVSCEGLKEKIDSIPLECELIYDELGLDWVGSDLSKYWWHGWLPKEWLESDRASLSFPFQGVQGEINDPYWNGKKESGLFTANTNGPPYQDVIGNYSCPKKITIDEDNSPVGVAASFVDLSNHGKKYESPSCGCIDDPYDALPRYIHRCQFPSYGENYPKYLEYVRSVDARYWDTPFESRLLRKAQMEMIKSQEIEFTVPGNLELRIGEIIKINFPPARVTGFAEDDIVNPMTGKWLVSKIKHTMTSANKYTMGITCIRDTNAYENGLPCRTTESEEEDE